MIYCLKLQNIKTGVINTERFKVEGVESSLSGADKAQEQTLNEMIERGYKPVYQYIIGGLRVDEDIAKSDPDNTCIEYEGYRYSWFFEE